MQNKNTVKFNTINFGGGFRAHYANDGAMKSFPFTASYSFDCKSFRHECFASEAERDEFSKEFIASVKEMDGEEFCVQYGW